LPRGNLRPAVREGCAGPGRQFLLPARPWSFSTAPTGQPVAGSGPGHRERRPPRRSKQRRVRQCRWSTRGRTFSSAPANRILTTLSLQASAGQTYYVLIEAVPGQSPLRVEIARNDAGRGTQRAVAKPRQPAPAAGRQGWSGRGSGAGPCATRGRAAAAGPLGRHACGEPATASRSGTRTCAAAPGAGEPAAQGASAARAPARAHRGQRSGVAVFAVIAKTGVFKLGSTSQSVTGWEPYLRQERKPVAAVEAELRHRDGYALGAEVFLLQKTPFFARIPRTLKGDQTVISGTLKRQVLLRSYELAVSLPGGGNSANAGASYGRRFHRDGEQSRVPGHGGRRTSGSATASACTSNSTLLNAPVDGTREPAESSKAGGNGHPCRPELLRILSRLRPGAGPACASTS